MKRKNINSNQSKIARKKPLKIYAQQLLMVAMTLILLILPINVSFDFPMFGPKVAHAESLKDIDILEKTNISSKMIEPVGTNTFRVNITGVNKRNKHIGGDGNVIHAHLNTMELPDGIKDNIKLKAVESGQVKVSFNPVDLSVVSGKIGRSVSSVTGFVQGASNRVLNVVDKILGSIVFKPFVNIEGIPEYINAYNDFKYLESNPLNIPDFIDDIPIEISDDNTIATMDFSDEVKRHLETNVEEIVVDTSNNFIDSIKNVKFEILPGLKFMSPLNNLINGAISALTDTTDKLNTQILAPIADGALTGLGLSNKQMVTGKVSSSMKLRFYDNKAICTDDGSEGHGTYPVVVRGAFTQKPITNTDTFFDIKASDDVAVIILPDEECEPEEVKLYAAYVNDLELFNPEATEYEAFISPTEFEAILTNPEKFSDPNTDISVDDKNEVREELGIDSDNDEANGEDGGESSDETEDADSGEKSDDADEDADEDDNGDADREKDEGSSDGAETQDVSDSSDINLDMDDLEEGIGLFKRILEVILEVINSFLGEEN